MIDLETPRRYEPRFVSLLRRRKRPKLLVSVRNGIEAAAAISGGCNIIDVKDPDRGTLGYAGRETIEEVAKVASASSTDLSVALGEVLDWQHRDVEPLPRSIRYGKLGLAGMGHDPNWINRLDDTRKRFDQVGCEFNWITVAYADYQAAHAPHPQSVFDSAMQCGSAGILIDTWSKSSGTVFDCMGAKMLHAMMAHAHLLLRVGGLAGRITLSQIPKAVSVHPSIIGVRSAACRLGDRHQPVDEDAVRSVRRAIDSEELNTHPIDVIPESEIDNHPQW